ncbi:MAG TPA: type II secretion system protein F, partial [Firmicutes bacterium]|nr:type II secretion system protein F [Bacillota bacterium]
MATTYTYKARNRSGQITTGKLDGISERDIALKLREKDLLPVSIQEYVASGDVMASVQKSKKIPLKVLTIFCQQFAVMINAGLALMPCISILQQQTGNKVFKEILGTVRTDLETGDSLSKALSRHPKAFPPIMINMVEAGEAGGVLDEVLNRVSEHFEKESALNRKVKSAMTSPIITIVIMIAITIGLIMGVLPTFAGMFEGTGVELPGITQFLLNFADFLKKYIIYVILTIAVVVFALSAYIRTPAGRLQKDTLMMRMPLFGPITLKTVASRFTRTFSTLMASGVPMLQCLEITSRVAGNAVAEVKLKEVSEAVRNGMPLGQSLDRSGLFPPMVVQMTIIGEETGSVDALLTKVAEFYDQEVDIAVGNL